MKLITAIPFDTDLCFDQDVIVETIGPRCCIVMTNGATLTVLNDVDKYFQYEGKHLIIKGRLQDEAHIKGDLTCAHIGSFCQIEGNVRCETMRNNNSISGTALVDGAMGKNNQIEGLLELTATPEAKPITLPTLSPSLSSSRTAMVVSPSPKRSYREYKSSTSPLPAISSPTHSAPTPPSPTTHKRRASVSMRGLPTLLSSSDKVKSSSLRTIDEQDVQKMTVEILASLHKTRR